MLWLSTPQEAVNLGQEDGEAPNLEDDGEANETRSTTESESITCCDHEVEATYMYTGKKILMANIQKTSCHRRVTEVYLN